MCDILSWSAIGGVIATIGIGIAINRWLWETRIRKLDIPMPEIIAGEAGFRFKVPKRESRYWAVAKIEVADGSGTLHKIKEIPGKGPVIYDPGPPTYEKDGEESVVVTYSPGLTEGIVGVTGDVSDVVVTVAEERERSFCTGFPVSLVSLREAATR